MAVEGWVGWHGQGKTYCCLEHNIKLAMARGQILVSNAGVVGALSPEDFASKVFAHISFGGTAADLGFVPVRFSTWDDLMMLIELAVKFKLSVRLVIDEGGKFLNARYWNKIDPRIQTIFQERRKIGGGLDLDFTVPSFKHVDSQLRDVTQYVHLCRRLGGSEYSHNGGGQPRLFYVKTFRPTALSDGVGNGVKRGARSVSRKLVPFCKDLADLYGTEVLEMDKPFAEKTLLRPDMGPLPDSAPAPAVVLLPAPTKGRRASR